MMKSWPVEIFRYSEKYGWELYQQQSSSSSEEVARPPHSSTTATCSNSSKGKKNSNLNNKNGSNNLKKKQQMNDTEENKDEGVTVVPCQGFVEVKKLRLRIHLFHKSNNNNKEQNNNNITNKNNNEQVSNRDSSIHTTVIRRRDTILLSSRKGLGAVVFKFRSIAECMSFADKLIELNADYVFNQTEDRNVQHQSTTTRPLKRMKVQDQNKNNNDRDDDDDDNEASRSDTTNNSSNNVDETIASSVEAQPDERNEAIRSYIVRLLHDGDFLHFVDNVEKSLMSSPDCTRILEALGTM